MDRRYGFHIRIVAAGVPLPRRIGVSRNAREAIHRAAGCPARDRQTPGPLPGDRLHIAGPAPADVRDQKGVVVALFSFLNPAPWRGTSVAPTPARPGRAAQKSTHLNSSTYCSTRIPSHALNK